MAKKLCPVRWETIINPLLMRTWNVARILNRAFDRSSLDPSNDLVEQLFLQVQVGDHQYLLTSPQDGGCRRLGQSSIARSLNLWILPVAVLGRSETNVILRGYL